MIAIPFSRLKKTHLTAGTVYEGGSAGNVSDDPLAKILKGGNAGSYRYCGSVDKLKYLIIILSPNDTEWSDTIDPESGTITCFGDNRRPGHELHETPKFGNLILKKLFKSLGSHKAPREYIPPIFLFSKHPNLASPRSVRFIGLCAPGSPHLKPSKYLTSVQRRIKSRRVKNYRAIFTVLDIPVIQRAWIDDLEAGRMDSSQRPIVWKMWQKSGLYRPLRQLPVHAARSIQDQLPDNNLRKAMLLKIYRYFSNESYQFMHFAADIYSRTDSRIVLACVRRLAPDNSFAITGKFRIGLDDDPTFIEFVTDAKCYNPGIGDRKRKSVGEKDILKAASRLGNRQFAVLVTTSVVTSQAYKAIQKQKRPIVCLAGKDIVNILQSIQIRTVKQLTEWLGSHYPVET